MSRRSAIAATCIGLVALGSYFTYWIGAATCHQDVGSEALNPRLCATVGSDVGLGFTPLVAIGAVVLLLALRVRTWILALATGLVIAAEVLVFALWVAADSASY